MSHVFWFDLPAYHKPLMVTDAVVNMAPSLKDKLDILANAIGFRMLSDSRCPRSPFVGDRDGQPGPCLERGRGSAFEDGRSRSDASAVIDGPLAFDNAISAASAATKGISSPVAGDPDILMVPNLDVGNVLYKSFIYMGKANAPAL